MLQSEEVQESWDGVTDFSLATAAKKLKTSEAGRARWFNVKRLRSSISFDTVFSYRRCLRYGQNFYNGTRIFRADIG